MVALHTAALLVHFAESIAGGNVAVVRGELEKSCGLTIVLRHSAAVGMASAKHELGRIVTFGGRRPEEPHRFAVVTRYPLPEIVERPEIGSGPRVALIGRELVEARRFGQVLPHAQPFLVVHTEIILGGSIAPVGARFQILLDRCGVATAGSLGHLRNRPDRARYRNEDRQAKTAKQRCALFICQRKASHALRGSSI